MITDEMIEAAAREALAHVRDIEPSQREQLVRAALEAADKQLKDLEAALKSARARHSLLVAMFRQATDTLGE